MSKSKKILLSIPALQGGGAERVLSTLANAWVEEGYEVRLVTYESPGIKPYYKLSSKIELVQLDCLSPCKYAKPFDVIKRVFGLRQKIKKFKPDIIISFLDTNNILTVLAALGLKVPVVVSERINPVLFLSCLKKKLRNWAYEKADALVVQNLGIKQCFSNSIQNHTKIIPNPVIIGNNIKWVGGKKEFVAVGRLYKQKGFQYLIDAFSEVTTKHPDWILKIIGEGPERSALETQIKQCGLEGKVLLPGKNPKAINDMASSDIFVFSSLYEGMPNALMEAMAIGMPVISSNCDFGPSDLINNNKNGILVPPKDPKSLANAMGRLASDPELQKALGAAAKKEMKKYELKKILVLWEKVFEGVINRHD